MKTRKPKPKFTKGGRVRATTSVGYTKLGVPPMIQKGAVGKVERVLGYITPNEHDPVGGWKYVVHFDGHSMSDNMFEDWLDQE